MRGEGAQGPGPSCRPPAPSLRDPGPAPPGPSPAAARSRPRLAPAELPLPGSRPLPEQRPIRGGGRLTDSRPAYPQALLPHPIGCPRRFFSPNGKRRAGREPQPALLRERRRARPIGAARAGLAEANGVKGRVGRCSRELERDDGNPRLGEWTNGEGRGGAATTGRQ